MFSLRSNAAAAASGQAAQNFCTVPACEADECQAGKFVQVAELPSAKSSQSRARPQRIQAPHRSVCPLSHRWPRKPSVSPAGAASSARGASSFAWKPGIASTSQPGLRPRWFPPRHAIPRAPSRTPHGHGQASYLTQLPGAAENLKLFENCHLLQAGSFDAAIAGCDAVLHTASPFFSKSDQKEGEALPLVAPSLHCPLPSSNMGRSNS